MPDQVTNQTAPTTLHQHRTVYWIIAIVVMLAVSGGTLIAIKNFNTEQDVNSIQIPAECTNHGGSALACSAVRSGKKLAPTTPASVQSNSATSTPATVDTSGWKTYTNSQYGFSFMYPPQWNTNNLGAETAVYFVSVKVPDQSSTVNVSWIPSSTILHFTDLTDYINAQYGPADIISKKNITQSGISWTILTTSPSWANGQQVVEALAYQNGIVYKIYSQNDSNNLPLFNQVLSTFKFTK